MWRDKNLICRYDFIAPDTIFHVVIITHNYQNSASAPKY